MYNKKSGGKKQMKILLIEDDENLAASMKFQLEKEGYETDICHDGEEGLYYMKEVMIW